MPPDHPPPPLPPPPPGAEPATAPAWPGTLDALAAIAASAEAASDWALTAGALRRLLALDGTAAGLHLRHGDALRQLGLAAAADAAYERASLLRPNDPGPVRRRAAVARMAGTPARAAALLSQTCAPGAAEAANAPVLPVRLFLSAAVGLPPSDPQAGLAGFPSLPHHSYALLAEAFLDGLTRLGLPCELLSRPEYVPDVRALSDSPVNIHIGAYPPEAFRLLKGAYNVAVVDWAFERLPLPAEIHSPNAFADPSVMLALPDEVWSLSSFGAEAIRRSVSTPVRAVPAPVPSFLAPAPRARPPSEAPARPMSGTLAATRWTPLGIVRPLLAPTFEEAERRTDRLDAVLARQPGAGRAPVFLSLLDVRDGRAQIKPVIEAFLQVSRHHPAALLLLKLSGVGAGTPGLNDCLMRFQVDQAADPPPMVASRQVRLTAEALSREDLVSLYDLADFYVSAPHGEGLNLPLIEAMGRGCVPVCVDHTAMRDYIDGTNAVVMRSAVRPFDKRLAARYGMSGLDTHYTSAADAADALDRALSLPSDAYAARSAAALDTVRTRFGLPAFAAGLRPTLDEAAGRPRRAPPA